MARQPSPSSRSTRALALRWAYFALLALAAVCSPVPRATAQQVITPEAQVLHILVNKSVIVNTQARLRRVLVSNPSVAEAMTISPTQVVVTANGPGATSLILWDENGGSRLMDVLVDVDVSQLRDALQQAYPNESIQVATDQGRVVLSGVVSSPAVADGAVKIASSFSNSVVNSLSLPPAPRDRQILLQVKIAEVDRSKLSQYGFNLFSTGGANTIGAVSTGQYSAPGISGTLTGTIGAPLKGTSTSFTATSLLNIFLFRPDLNLGATIQDLETKNILQILAEPDLLALNGKTANFLAGGEFPFPVVQGISAGATAVTIQFRPFGVKLEFTGTIVADNVIHLKVSPEVSALDFSNAVTISGFTIPAISTRRAETEVELKDGQSFGIAGLMDQRVTAQLSKIPGIGDIPILGQLFRSKSMNKSHTELLVLVTPRIIDPVAGAASAPPPAMPIPTMELPSFDKGLPNGGGAPPAPATR